MACSKPELQTPYPRTSRSAFWSSRLACASKSRLARACTPRYFLRSIVLTRLFLFNQKLELAESDVVKRYLASVQSAGGEHQGEADEDFS